MGFLRDRGLGAAQPGTLTSLVDPGDIAGTDAAKQAKEASKKAEQEQLEAIDKAIAETQRSTAEGQAFLAPFGDVGVGGTEQAGFLTDPQAQFDFLQNNPLFQLGLENANRQTQQQAAARGRLSAGDTLQQLNQNALLTAQPLIADQKQSIGDLLNFGSGIARAQSNTALGQGSDISNLIQNQGNIKSAGIQGRNQIRADTTANQQQTAAQIFSMFSDPALKTDVVHIGKDNGHNIYSWTWNDKAHNLGLYGTDKGVMADEVKQTSPDAVHIDESGYMKVDYSAIGVNH